MAAGDRGATQQRYGLGLAWAAAPRLGQGWPPASPATPVSALRPALVSGAAALLRCDVIPRGHAPGSAALQLTTEEIRLDAWEVLATPSRRLPGSGPASLHRACGGYVSTSQRLPNNLNCFRCLNEIPPRATGCSAARFCLRPAAIFLSHSRGAAPQGSQTTELCTGELSSKLPRSTGPTFPYRQKQQQHKFVARSREGA